MHTRRDPHRVKRHLRHLRRPTQADSGLLGASPAGSEVTRRLTLLEASPALRLAGLREPRGQEGRGNLAASILNPDEKELGGYCATSRNREKKNGHILTGQREERDHRAALP